MALAEVYKKLAMAEKQIADNQLLDGDEVFAKLRSKHEKKYKLKITQLA